MLQQTLQQLETTFRDHPKKCQELLYHRCLQLFLLRPYVDKTDDALRHKLLLTFRIFLRLTSAYIHARTEQLLGAGHPMPPDSPLLALT